MLQHKETPFPWLPYLVRGKKVNAVMYIVNLNKDNPMSKDLQPQHVCAAAPAAALSVESRF